MKKLFLILNLFIAIKISIGINSNTDLFNIELLTKKIDVNLYKKSTKNESLKNINLKNELNKIVSYNNTSQILNNKIGRSIIDLLRFNWQLENMNIKKEIHWILFLLIFNVEKYIERPKKMKLIKNYGDCLTFIKSNIKIFLKKINFNNQIELMQRSCVIFIDLDWKITSKWNNINNLDYIELSRKIVSSDFYLTWREFYKIDPARSQWFILRKIASNDLDELLRILRILVIDKKEYEFIENILAEFMTQFKTSFDDSYLNDYSFANKLHKYNFKQLFTTKNKRKKKLKKNKVFEIYLPREMPDLYVYHHQVETCTLNLSIMSLYPELNVYFYNVLTRTPIYYLFHRKSISVTRKALLRSNQLCSFMFEMNKRLERSYYLFKLNNEVLDINKLNLSSSEEILDNKRVENIKEYLKPLNFHPFYYSTPFDINLEIFYINWLVGLNNDTSIKKLLKYSEELTGKHRNLFLNVKSDFTNQLNFKNHLENNDNNKNNLVNDGLYFDKIKLNTEELIKKAKKLIEYITSIKDDQFDLKDDLKPTFSSLIPLIYINSRLWSIQKLWYKYPVSMDINLNKIVTLTNNIKVKDKKLSEIKVIDISTCIKIVTILWRHDGLKVNNRGFRILDSNNDKEIYDKSKNVTKTYQDYATIYLLCVKTVSQAIIYYRRFLNYKFPIEYPNNWKLNKLYDMNDESSSNSFQFINEKNINLHSLPNDFVLPKLTKGVYISILTGYILLSFGALCIQTLITVLI